ncbi:ClbS/DfsB family four-helix bundle protein [Marinilactibacillus psychrotolerans]|uniref:ClbS/DfsB family four-helix bundle protein n=1 Tax=Marinilactibacillus psychrotolerans TaxID=191770 RepID=UPI0038860BC7
MSRPQTKTELIEAAEKEFNMLFSLIESIPEEKRMESFPFEDRDKNIRDVLMHLYKWHLMMLKWYEVGMQGGIPAMPAEGYSWKELPVLNQKIWKSVQSVSLLESEEKLIYSHERVMQLIQEHTNEEMFTKKYYKWTKTTSLGSYFISNTSSHYIWGQKKIKKFKKSIND